MVSHVRRVTVILCLVTTVFCVFSCEKKKEGKVAVTDQQFSLIRSTENGFEIKAKGKIKNVGEADVKQVIVTGRCRSCIGAMVDSKWFVSDYEKMEDQKAIINYLPVGGEKEFSFVGVAFYYGRKEIVPELPELLEVEILSYATVND